MRHITLSALVLLTSATFAGCAKSAADLTPVEGKVTVNGAPLATGAVTFHPDSTKGNTTPHIPVGNIDAQGNYKLMSATDTGAPLGWYQVTISAQAPIDPQNPYAPPKYLIPAKYADINASGLSIEVVKSPAPGAYDLKLAK